MRLSTSRLGPLLALPLLGDLVAAAQVGAGASLAAGPLLLKDIKTIFAFGDSYTANGYTPWRGFDPEGEAQEIHTTSGGDNWVQYLAKAADASSSLYDFAISGSTVEPVYLGGSSQPNPSLANETETWLNWFANKTDVEWDARSSLFIVASGINDIANSILYDLDYESSVEKLVVIYSEEIARLYRRGARQFLFVTVPPFSRTPLGLDGSYHAEFVRWVHIWNFRFAQMVGSFAQTFPEMHVRVWDMHQELNEIIDSALQLGFKDSTSSCWSYAVIRGYEPDANARDCPHALAEYIWKDAAHPTWPVHQLMAKSLVSMMAGDAPGEVHNRARRRSRSTPSWR